jgi:formate dehydrogenase gamma subunit
VADVAVSTSRPERYRRFSTAQIIEHWIQVIAFVALALTGLVQRYSGAAISKWLIDAMGGIEATRIIHRVFATLLMLAVVYHFGAIGYRKYVKREPKSMVPTMDDLRAVGQSVGHVAGIRRRPPRQGRYTWEEKVEYWALIWGTVVMILTGFLLWNPIATTLILPGEFIPTAKAVHSGEAMLAVLAVIVWHMYHVHIREWNPAMFTGYLSRKQMEEEHPLELEAIERGETLGATDPDEISRRSRLYFPAFAVIAAILLVGIYFFISFENTAITTIEPIEPATIFSPVETTSTTAGPSTTTTVPGTTTTTGGEVVSWDGVVAGFFDPTCTGCHGSGNQTSGLDLSSYDTAVTGGNRGAGIVPGDPEGSVVYQVMSSGSHPALLPDDQLEVFRAWIAAGAPETDEDAGTTTTVPSAGPSWDVEIAALFDPTCTGCHGASNQTSGLDLSSYDSALTGGSRGPGIVPGDPEASVIVQMMGGSHPAQLSPEDLDLLITWIEAGAPEQPGSGPPADTTTTTEAVAFTWNADFAPIMDQRCTTCHNPERLTSGLDLTSYEGAVAGGSRGPGIVPGDPDGSVVYQILEPGDHVMTFRTSELAALRSWISAGAPED